MSYLILDTEDHYPERVSQMASTALAKIKTRFNAVGFREKVETCSFRQFFLAPELKFSR